MSTTKDPSPQDKPEDKPEDIDDRQYNGVIFKATDISLTLGGNLILDRLSCEIQDVVRPGTITGQVISLLGPSGVGKSQFLRIAAGLNQPDRGEVRLGANLELAARGMMGFVAQDYPLFEHQRVLKNLVIAGRQAGLSTAEAKDKAHHYLERFRLIERKKLYPAQLSGGQRQRVAIAQQLMTSAAFLVMDEPFSGLDPVQVDNVVRLVFEIAAMDELNTIIVVTHDVEAAVLAADTVWMMGYDRDEEGVAKPGARIQDVVDLVPDGLAWWQDPTYDTPRFQERVRDLRGRFVYL